MIFLIKLNFKNIFFHFNYLLKINPMNKKYLNTFKF